MHLVAATAALAGLSLLAACHGSAATPTSSGTDRIASMPGVRAMTVDEHGAVIDTDRGATADQVADALRAVVATGPRSVRLYLGAGGTEPALELLDWRASMIEATDPAAVGRLGQAADDVAAELLALSDTRGAVTQVARISGDLDEVTVVLDTPGFPSGDAVDRIGSVYARAIHGWGGRVPTHVEVTAYDRSGDTSTELATIDATDGARPLADADVDLDWIGSGDSAWFPSVIQDSSGAVAMSVALSVPSSTVDGGLLRKADDDELWREIRSRLAPLGSARPGSTLEVDLVDTSGQRILGYDPLFTLTVGADGEATSSPDPHHLGWGRAAARAVNAL